MTTIERSGVERRPLPRVAGPGVVADRLSDIDHLTRIVLPVLDEPHSRLDDDPPVWSLPAKKIGPLTLRTATAMRVSREGDTVLVVGERTEHGDVPMALRVELTPEPADEGVVLVSRWELQLESALPWALLRIARRVIDATIAETTETLLGAIGAEFADG